MYYVFHYCSDVNIVSFNQRSNIQDAFAVMVVTNALVAASAGITASGGMTAFAGTAAKAGADGCCCQGC